LERITIAKTGFSSPNHKTLSPFSKFPPHVLARVWQLTIVLFFVFLFFFFPEQMTNNEHRQAKKEPQKQKQKNIKGKSRWDSHHSDNNYIWGRNTVRMLLLQPAEVAYLTN
jgi:hypothetical protein